MSEGPVIPSGCALPALRGVTGCGEVAFALHAHICCIPVTQLVSSCPARKNQKLICTIVWVFFFLMPLFYWLKHLQIGDFTILPPGCC